MFREGGDVQTGHEVWEHHGGAGGFGPAHA